MTDINICAETYQNGDDKPIVAFEFSCPNCGGKTRLLTMRFDEVVDAVEAINELAALCNECHEAIDKRGEK